MAAGEFAYVAVREQGIDVAVKVTGPEGRFLGWYDGGKDGERHDPLSAVTLFAQVTGPHWLDIHPVDPMQHDSGSYTARLHALEPAAAEPLARVEQWLRPWDLDNQPGLVVGIARNGESVFLRGYGEAVVEHGVPNDPGTVFHAASLTKQFVGFAVQLLAARGDLALDDDVRTYLPWVPALGATVTLRHLLHHTHGFPGQLPRLKLAGWDPLDVHEQRHVLDLVRRQRRLQFEPGSAYMYTNTGYELLVEVVQAVTGRSFAEWFDEQVFGPLGMSNSFFLVDPQRLIPHLASAYFVDAAAGILRDPEPVVLVWGGIGLYTTVEDLLKWARNLQTGRMGGEAVRDRMRERGRLNDGTRLDYASGLEIIDYPAGTHYSAGTALFHGGAWNYTRSILLVLPDEDLSIAVISNRGGFDRSTLAFRIADLMLRDTVAGNAHYREMAPYQGTPAAGDPAAGEPDPGRLDAFTGRYVLDDHSEAHLFRSGDRLWLLEEQDSPPIALRLHGDTARMAFPALPVQLVFERNREGDVVGFRQVAAGEPPRRGVKTRRWAPDSLALQDYAGAYRSDELRSTWTFRAEEGMLIGHHERRGDAMILRPHRLDTFRGDGWSNREVEFLRDGDGTVVAVLFHSERYRGERFDRIGRK